jgi:protein-disulfide isomerase
VNPSRRSVLLGLSLSGLAAPALAQKAPEPERIPVELVEDTLALPSAVRLGHPHGDVIMVEFFDYNCPWCKRSAGELEALLKAEPDLTYVLMNYPILDPASVEAARVALGYLQLRGPGDYLTLHRGLFGLRGPVNGARAMGVAKALGLDEERLAGLALGEPTTRVLNEAIRLGNSLGLVATPSFVLTPLAYIGGMNLDQKRAAIAEARG